MSFSDKEKTLINFLLSYYKNKIDILFDIINQKTSLSLRLIDWLVTNYSKKYNIAYQLTKNSEIIFFNIFIDYKNQLRAYSKKFFDPFCRQKRIIINTITLSWREYDSSEDLKNCVVTTVGQLNFFKWFIENKIFEYAIKNIHLVDNDMIATMKNKNKSKRSVLSPSAVKGIYTNNTNITVKFKY